MTMIEHLSAAEITAFVDGEMPPGERVRLTTHLESCAECRDEVGDVVRLLRDAPMPQSQVKRRRIRGPMAAAIGTLLAASVATVILVKGSSTLPESPVVRTTEPAVNHEARATMAAISPDDGAAVSAQRITLTWHSANVGLYHVTLAAPDGASLWSAQTPDTTVVIPDSIEVEAGRVYFWYVDAVADGITASTALRRLRVQR